MEYENQERFGLTRASQIGLNKSIIEMSAGLEESQLKKDRPYLVGSIPKPSSTMRQSRNRGSVENSVNHEHLHRCHAEGKGYLGARLIKTQSRGTNTSDENLEFLTNPRQYDQNVVAQHQDEVKSFKNTTTQLKYSSAGDNYRIQESSRNNSISSRQQSSDNNSKRTFIFSNALKTHLGKVGDLRKDFSKAPPIDPYLKSYMATKTVAGISSTMNQTTKTDRTPSRKRALEIKTTQPDTSSDEKQTVVHRMLLKNREREERHEMAREIIDLINENERILETSSFSLGDFLRRYQLQPATGSSNSDPIIRCLRSGFQARLDNLKKMFEVIEMKRTPAHHQELLDTVYKTPKSLAQSLQFNPNFAQTK